MTNQAYPSVDGIAPSWSDISATFTISGGALFDVSAIAGIKTGRKVDVGEQRGISGGRVMARTTGQTTYEASATFYRSGLRTLIKGLMDAAPSRGNQKLISIVAFDILVQHTPPGETEIYVRKLKGCRFLGEDMDMKEGPDADKVELTFNPIEIVDIINGQEALLL